MKIRLSNTSASTCLLSVLFALLLIASGCIPSTPPGGGINVTTFEAISGIGNSEFPLPNVPNRGNVLPGPDGFQILGPGTGRDLEFSGLTDFDAISKYPDARTNARWQATAGPTAAPPCAAGTAVQDVPADGAIFKFVCTTLRRF